MLYDFIQSPKMSLRIIKAGLLDTIQDPGRFGYQHLGINPGGTMDRLAASWANALLGKELISPVIELHFPASQFLFQKACIICLTGADFSPVINKFSIPLYQPVFIPANAVLKFEGWKQGARCYLSIYKELQLHPWLASFSTNLKAVAGGLAGRKLQKDDELDYNDLLININEISLLPWRHTTEYSYDNRIEFIPGNEWSWLSDESKNSFVSNYYVVSFSSDRMGYRLQGKTLEPSTNEQLVSSAVSFGTVQLLPSGQLIILMADHQTTGGYPRIAHVITTHLPKLAQMKAGDKLIFVKTTIEAAQKKLLAQQQYLMQIQKTCNLKIQNWLHAH